MNDRVSPREATELTVRFFKSVLEASNDGVTITDLSFSIIEANQKFAAIFNTKCKLLMETNLLVWIKKADPEIPTKWLSALDKIYSHKQTEIFEYTFFDRCFEISGSAVANEKDTSAVLWVFRDITERKQAEEKREQLFKELQEALSEIKTLGGLLPICSSCKKIRDDKGYWNQMETYIRDHSEADFSHSICPECSKKLYPELFND